MGTKSLEVGPATLAVVSLTNRAIEGAGLTRAHIEQRAHIMREVCAHHPVEGTPRLACTALIWTTDHNGNEIITLADSMIAIGDDEDGGLTWTRYRG